MTINSIGKFNNTVPFILTFSYTWIKVCRRGDMKWYNIVDENIPTIVSLENISCDYKKPDKYFEHHMVYNRINKVC